MARNEYWKGMAYYRLDRITNMSITEKKLTPITTVEGYENGINYKDLSTALPYMYTDKPEQVEFIAESYIIDQIIDWFGKDIRISKYDDNDKQIKVSVRVSLMAMEHWAMQYINHVKIVAPQILVDKIKSNLYEATEKYNCFD